MDNEPKDNSINKLAWSVLIVAVVLLAGVFAWKWYSHTAETPSPEAAAGAPVEASQPAPVVINLNTPPPPQPPVVAVTPPAPREPHTVKPPSILARNPQALTEQSDMMRKRAAALRKTSPDVTTDLAPTEEQIMEYEKKGLLVQ